MNLKLTMEVIPTTSHFNNVRSHVTAAQWDKIKRACYQEAGYQCEICYGRGPKHPVECHEVWDYNMKTGIQKLVKLIALCPACHEVKHFGLAQKKGREAFAIKHFLKVNKCTMDDLRSYHQHVFEEFNWRSKMEWKLDMSLLGIK